MSAGDTARVPPLTPGRALLLRPGPPMPGGGLWLREHHVLLELAAEHVAASSPTARSPTSGRSAAVPRTGPCPRSRSRRSGSGTPRYATGAPRSAATSPAPSGCSGGSGS